MPHPLITAGSIGSTVAAWATALATHVGAMAGGALTVVTALKIGPELVKLWGRFWKPKRESLEIAKVRERADVRVAQIEADSTGSINIIKMQADRILSLEARLDADSVHLAAARAEAARAMSDLVAQEKRARDLDESFDAHLAECTRDLERLRKRNEDADDTIRKLRLEIQRLHNAQR